MIPEGGIRGGKNTAPQEEGEEEEGREKRQKMRGGKSESKGKEVRAREGYRMKGKKNIKAEGINVGRGKEGMIKGVRER